MSQLNTINNFTHFYYSMCGCIFDCHTYRYFFEESRPLRDIRFLPDKREEVAIHVTLELLLFLSHSPLGSPVSFERNIIA